MNKNKKFIQPIMLKELIGLTPNELNQKVPSLALSSCICEAMTCQAVCGYGLSENAQDGYTDGICDCC